MPKSHKPDQLRYIPPGRRLRSPTRVTPHVDSTQNGNAASSDRNLSRLSLSSLDDLNNSLRSLSLSTISQYQFPTDCTADKGLQKTISSGAEATSESVISKPNIDYTKFRHLIELYGFDQELDNAQIEAQLSEFQEDGFCLKWVDDTHCLVVFASNDVASRALSQFSGTVMKARRIENASLPSKWKLLKSPGDWSLPYKRRPETSSAAAHRFISHYLGIPRNSSSSDLTPEEADRKRCDRLALVEARTRYRECRKAKKAIWEDESLDFK